MKRTYVVGSFLLVLIHAFGLTACLASEDEQADEGDEEVGQADDALSGSGIYQTGRGGNCVSGTKYCGGDKVSGYADKLYVCKSGHTAVKGSGVTCRRGCVTVSGAQDRCR